jgi:hypothetical protein
MSAAATQPSPLCRVRVGGSKEAERVERCRRFKSWARSSQVPSVGPRSRMGPGQRVNLMRSVRGGPGGFEPAAFGL